METKKKRVRPTWKQVMELEDTVSRQCAELRAWREKYHDLKKGLKRKESRSLWQVIRDRILNW